MCFIFLRSGCIDTSILDFNWVYLMSSANINFYGLTGAKSASQVPQPITNRVLQNSSLFFIALSVFGTQNFNPHTLNPIPSSVIPASFTTYPEPQTLDPKP